MATIETKTFPVQGMSCASCAQSVESMLQEFEGVKNASVNYATQSVLVEFSPEIATPEVMKKAVQDIGYDLVIDIDDEDTEKLEAEKAKALNTQKIRTYLAIILAIPVVIIGMFFHHGFPGSNWIMFVLSAVILFVLGKNFFINAYKQAKHFRANMDTLVALSTGIAFVFSAFNTIYPEFFISRGLEPHVYYESAAVIVAFILLGKYFEERAKHNSASAIRKLMGLQPKTVKVVRNGEELEIVLEAVEVGETIIVRPAERIPVDGKVIQGHSYIDESMLTGEPVPAEKKMNDNVFAGTLNQNGSLQIEALQVGKKTLLAQIIQHVKEAQGSKAPVQKLADKIAGIFVPVVLIIAILTFALWQIFGGDNSLTHALTATIAVLIIACPCALGLATPTALMVGIGKGAENGILIKNAESLENAHKMNAIVLDKTGTITEGFPRVENIFWSAEVSEKELLESVLYTIESRSEHPLALAVTEYYKANKPGSAIPVALESFEIIPGKGVRASYNGTSFLLGSQKLMFSENIEIPADLKAKIEEQKSFAATIIVFSENKIAKAVLSITDAIKESAPTAIKSLQEMGIEVHMLTGDNNTTAEAVAKKVGISFFNAEVLPNEKADYIKEIRAKHKTVGMVGDGINDAQALAEADVSIAMGKGTDIAMDVAQLTLMQSDLQHLVRAIKLSRATVNTIRQNLFWAFFYNVICIPVAAGILYPIWGFQLDPMLAGAAMALSSVSVVLNSLRLKYVKLNG